MQLRTPLSIAAALVIAASAQAEDSVSVQYLHYVENDDRTTVSAPSVELNKAFGTDVELNVGFVYDSVSGATPTFYDGASGASAFSRAVTTRGNLRYGNVEYEDERKAYSGLLTYRLPSRDELKLGANYSTEHDFDSTEGSAEYMHWLDDAKSRSISFGMSFQSNEVVTVDHNALNAPKVDGVSSASRRAREYRDDDDDDRHESSRESRDDDDGESGASQVMEAETLNMQVGFSQVIDAGSYVKAALFYIQESGYLTNPYLNVVRNYYTAPEVTNENRPDEKSASGMSLRYITTMGENTALHLGYRYYGDDWEVVSHTVDAALYFEASDALTLGVKGRFYTQSEAYFYSGMADYFTDERYATSDFRMSAYDAVSYGAEFDYRISHDVSYNLGATYYDQTTGLEALYVGTGFTYYF